MEPRDTMELKEIMTRRSQRTTDGEPSSWAVWMLLGLVLGGAGLACDLWDSGEARAKSDRGKAREGVGGGAGGEGEGVSWGGVGGRLGRDQGGLLVQATPSRKTSKRRKGSTKKTPLGVKDKGVFSRFDKKVGFGLPAGVSARTTRIFVNKAKRILVLYHKGVPVKVYPVALGFTPKGDKVKRGDGKTPEGHYTLFELLDKNLASKYGARSMRLSYPNTADAKRGLRAGLISPKAVARIAAAEKKGVLPPQNTPLGSSLRIHGGGVGRDWTAGCVALRDRDVVELYGVVKKGTKVTIVAKKTPGDRDKDGIPDAVDIHIGAKKLVLNGASYKGGYFSLKYPMGDLPSHIGVCSDVVIRAFRNAGYDLQRLMHRDIKKHPKRYPRVTKRGHRPDASIDHRRVANLLPYFKAHFKLVNRKCTRKNRRTFLPGDVVFMDTLSRAGPDHIGIVTDTLGRNGYPKVINNWTYGYKTSEMELLPGVPITHHFRVR